VIVSRYSIPLAANEVFYNLMHRNPESDGVLDACKELDVALVAYRPLASGLFSGKGSVRGLEAIELVATLDAIAKAHGKSIGQVALNWLLARDEHIIPIPGATKSVHATENAEALSFALSDKEFEAIDPASSFWKRD
jgi:aryl-alcohol dehydrogenase-like predicted oxidoreductase